MESGSSSRPKETFKSPTASQVKVRWEEVKAQERGGKAKAETLLSGIPRALPALLRAYQIGARAHSVGFDWDKPIDVVSKIREEVEEVAEVVGAEGTLGVVTRVALALVPARAEARAGPTCRV